MVIICSSYLIFNYNIFENYNEDNIVICLWFRFLKNLFII